MIHNNWWEEQVMTLLEDKITGLGLDPKEAWEDVKEVADNELNMLSEEA